MNYFPTDAVSWIYLFLFISLLFSIYLLAVRKTERQQPRRQKYGWRFLLWILISVLFNSVFKIPLSEELEILNKANAIPITVYLFSLFPMIYFAYHSDYLATVIIATVCGLTQSISGEGNVYFVLLFISLGLLIRYFSSLRSAILSRKMIQHPILSSVWAGVVIYPILTATVFFFWTGTFQIRFGNALVSGLSLWSSVFIALICGGGLLEAYYFLRKRKEPVNRKYSWWRINLFTKIPILLFFALFSVSLIWQYFYQKNYTESIEKVIDLGESVVEGYTDFIEIGKSVIQINHDSDKIINAIQQNRLKDVLPAIYHEIPFFQEVAIYDGDVLSDVYPEDAEWLQYFLNSTREDRLQQIAGTEIPYRVEVMQPDAQSAFYLFYTPIRNSDVILLGLVSPQENLLLSSKMKESNYYSEIAWLLTDSLGGNIQYENGIDDLPGLSESIFPEDTKMGSVTQGNYTEAGQGYYLIKENGDVKTIFSAIILNEKVTADTFHDMIPIFILEIAILVLVYFYTKYHMESIKSDVRILSQTNLSSNRGRLNEAILNPALFDLQSLYRENQLANSEKISQEKSSLKVIQELSKVNTMDDVLDIILNNEYLSEMGALRLVLNPEIASFLGYGRKTSSFGTGRSLNRYAFLDTDLYTKMKTEQLRIISDCKKSTWLGDAQETKLPGSLTVFSLRSRDVYFGIVWVADHQIRKFDPEDIRFFNIVANQISISLANMYAIRLEEANKARIEFLIQSIPEPVLVLNRRLQLVLINSAARSLNNVFASEISKGMDPDEFVTDSILHKFLKQTLIGKKMVDQLKLSNGKVYSANLVIAAEKTWFQNDWIICTLHDVSTFREKEEISSDFLETVAQYLQTPLHMTSGYLAMLSMVGDLNQAQKEYVSNVKLSVEKMDTFVNDLLDINRLSSGLGLEYKLIFATDLIADVISDLNPLAKQRQVIVISDDIPRRIMSKVELDEKLFYQAIYNLIKNGIEKNKMTGEVEIQLHVEGSDLLFIVRDTGVGIAPLDIPEIFSRIQHKTIRIDGQKAGLELPLVKSIIERHHGEIWVESDLGKGSTFYIRVPRVRQK